MRKGQFLTMSFFVLALWMGSQNFVQAQNNQTPTACFQFDMGGGYPDGIIINFNPSCSLPSVGLPGLYYRMVWNFNANCPVENIAPNPDLVAAPLIVDTGYVTLAAAKSIQIVQYTWPGDQPLEKDLFACVQLRFQVAKDQAGNGMVESVLERRVHISFPNFSPRATLEIPGSQEDSGNAPLMISVNADRSYDPDGYFLWGSIDWGDGNRLVLTRGQLDLLPQNLGNIPHSAGGYNLPGIYKVSLNLIDNGRVPLDQAAGFVAPSTNPQEVLTAAIAYQAARGDPPGPMDANGNRLDPQLRTDELFIRVLGGFSVLGGGMKVRLNRENRDSLVLKMKLHGRTVPSGGTTLTFTFSAPVGGGSLTSTSFIDDKGKIKGDLVSGSLDSDNGIMVIKVRSAPLKNTMDYYHPTDRVGSPSATSSTSGISNGFAQINITCSGLTGGTISEVVKFVYSSGSSSGRGIQAVSANNPG